METKTEPQLDDGQREKMARDLICGAYGKLSVAVSLLPGTKIEGEFNAALSELKSACDRNKTTSQTE